MSGYAGSVIIGYDFRKFDDFVLPLGVLKRAGDGPAACGGTHRHSRFADLHRAQKILGHKDRWAKQLSDFDLGARQKSAEPTNLKEFLDSAADAGRAWTAEEKFNWKAVVGKLSDAMKGLNLRLPNIDLVKTTGAEEFGAAGYTQGTRSCFRSQ